MKNVPESLGNGVAAEDRFAGQLGYRAGSRRDHSGLSGEQGNGTAQSIGSVMDVPLPTQPGVSLGELDPLAPPTFPGGDWADGGSPGSLADHPLLRGLLLELPPKGTAPQPAWMDRWFEAARSILELLYVQNPPGSGAAH